MKSIVPVVLLMIVMVLTGCTQNDAIPIAPPTKVTSLVWKVPTPGTIYIYQIVNTIGLSSDTSIDTISVVANGLERLNKSDVFETVIQGDTTMYHIEANGDISSADLLAPVPHWSLFPTGGGSRISDPVVDSTRSDGTHIRVTSDRIFVGRETLALAKSYDCLYVQEIDTSSAIRAVDSSFSISEQVQDTWFIPEIGSFGQLRITETNRSSHEVTGFTSTITLIGYFPK